MTSWQDHPFGISVKKGETVVFCMCNNSKNGPHCDGSHKGTGIIPKVITFERRHNTCMWLSAFKEQTLL